VERRRQISGRRSIAHRQITPRTRDLQFRHRSKRVWAISLSSCSDPLDGPSTAYQVRDEHDQGDNEKQVDQPPANVSHETKQPQKHQNADDRPQHNVSSIDLASRSTRKVNKASPHPALA
jgi:hypothetical protein